MTDPGGTITAVTLRRGPCRGFCPVYEVTLRGDGTADWNGERHVDRVGRHHGQVELGEFEKLAAFVERCGFFSWDSDYSSDVSDLPDYELTVVAGERTKRVRQNGMDSPPDFWTIAALVDGIAAATDWTAGSLGGRCGQWSATLTMHGIVAPLLSVSGVCTFPTTGYEVELRRHRPQSGDPAMLLLDRIVTEPSVGGDAITEVEVSYFERTIADRVTILPDGVTIDVQVLDEPPDFPR